MTSRHQPRAASLDKAIVALTTTVRARHGKTDAALVGRAFAVAERVHAGELRKSGDAYITHPIAVARILADLGADGTVVSAALLHDVPNPAYGVSDIRAEFGVEIATIIEGLVRLDHDDLANIAGADPRALTLKIVDRLHNLQTIRFLNSAKQRQKAEQTLRVLVPLADTLGLTGIRDELKQLARETLRREAPLLRLGLGPAAKGGADTTSAVNPSEPGGQKLPSLGRGGWFAHTGRARDKEPVDPSTGGTPSVFGSGGTVQ